jgi:hypothetical protein
MERIVDGQPLYEADISTGLECEQPPDGGPAVVTVQVHANCTLTATSILGKGAKCHSCAGLGATLPLTLVWVVKTLTSENLYWTASSTPPWV